MVSKNVVFGTPTTVGNGSDVLVVEEVRNLLRCGKTKVYELFESGDLEGFRVGDGIRVFRASVTHFIESHANRRPEPPAPRPASAAKRFRKKALLQVPLIGGYGHGL